MARHALLLLWDCLSWALAVGIIVGFRYEFYLSTGQWNTVFLYIGLAWLAQLVVGTLLKLYRGKYRVGTLDNALGLILSMVIVALALIVAFLTVNGLQQFPQGIVPLAPPFALLLMAAGRGFYRAWATTRSPRREDAENVLIYGTGDAGYQLLQLMQMDTASPYRAVGLIDDDPRKRHLTLLGTGVLGGRADLVDKARKHNISAVIFAISSAGPKNIREVTDLVEGVGMKFFPLPPLGQMIGGQVRMSDVKEVDTPDVLGRRQVKTDISAIAGYLTKMRVLVTGAGRSLGSELARQVHKFGPAELILLDRDESALHGVQLSIYGKALLDTPFSCWPAFVTRARYVSCSRTTSPTSCSTPPRSSTSPCSSTTRGRAGRPTSVAPKYCSSSRRRTASRSSSAFPPRRLQLRRASTARPSVWPSSSPPGTASGTYLSVRFGNVLGSRGSMLHTLREQIAQGGPITVTHPELTRYFMTIPEASELVIQPGAIGDDGELLVLDVGEPAKILDVAKRLIIHSGKDVDIVFTGLRPNEKMHDALFHEKGLRRHHPLITHVRVPPLPPDEVSTEEGSICSASGRQATPGAGNR